MISQTFCGLWAGRSPRVKEWRVERAGLWDRTGQERLPEDWAFKQPHGFGSEVGRVHEGLDQPVSVSAQPLPTAAESRFPGTDPPQDGDS